MNRFTLNQLRADVLIHADLTWYYTTTSFWQEQWIDWMLIQLIGSDHYDLMLRHPNMVIVFKPNTQYLAFNWS